MYRDAITPEASCARGAVSLARSDAMGLRRGGEAVQVLAPHASGARAGAEAGERDGTSGRAPMKRRDAALADVLVALDRPLEGARARTGTELIVVHCAATPPSMDIGAAEIDRWHRARGFRSIGYHAVIRRSGQIEAGRALGAMGAHARGFNAVSVGICLVGGLAEDGVTPAPSFTGAQFAALDRLVSALGRVYPGARLVGHRDLPNVDKACPCFDVSLWAAVRRDPLAADLA